jgi:hypothetical protein
MRRMLSLIAAVLLALGMLAAPAMAQHPSAGFPNEPVIPPHQHFINGRSVGPDACAMGMSLGFDHFHINVHLGRPGLGVPESHHIVSHHSGNPETMEKYRRINEYQLGLFADFLEQHAELDRLLNPAELTLGGIKE